MSEKQGRFAEAIQVWTEIDLQNVQKKLDEQGIELKTEQKESLASRKALASKTKDFKKLSDEEKLDQIKPLLKQYQNEIDSLTAKQKKTESFFFGFYRLIAEAPDPKPLLELSIDAVSELSEAASLKQEISRLNEELAKRADYDVLKQRLLQNEQTSAEVLSSRLKSQNDQFKSILDEKESNFNNKLKQNDDLVESYKKTIAELKTSVEVTELQLNSQNKQLQNDSSAAPVSSTFMAELDMAHRDAELWKKRVLELEQRNEVLRKDLSSASSDSAAEATKQEFQKKLANLESENAFLAANLDQLKSKIAAITKENESRALLLQRDLQNSTKEISNLKAKLESTADYDELKHELHLLRQIEFGDDPDDDSNKQIDSLLIQKNKAMASELASFRSQHEGLISQISSLQTQLSAAAEEHTKLQQLNAKLENDLADIREVQGSQFNDNSSLMSGMSRMTRATNKTSISSTTDENSILPIITKQRDRFRDRNKELEDELKRNSNQLNDLRRQIRILRSDNEELYEKTRYMASLKSGGSSSSDSRQGASKRLFVPKANAQVDPESDPYREQYESKLHPIEQFRLDEQRRISSRLSPIERIFIFITRSILATRTTRMLFMAYCVFLHFLVMFTTIHSVNLSTKMIPEVGLNHSTGGVADADSMGP